MVPRWRNLGVTLQSRELGSPRTERAKAPASQATGSDLLMRLERWRLSPGLVSAAELVEACIVEGREREAVNAARRLVAVDLNAAPLIRDQAARLLARTGHADDIPPEMNVLVPTQSARLQTRIHPHDPLAWVELALCQTIHGAGQAAERSMRVALDLAPGNRHVLRSAARLYLHGEDPERALAIISHSPATRGDPWLMASEIALAQVAEKPSRFLKFGQTMLGSGGIDPRQITELAGSVATEELVHGNRRKSRKSFLQSMLDPTGSALAQGEWATSALGELIAQERLEGVFENAEAMAFHLFRLRRLSEVAEACERWAMNDPFSVRPFEFGTATAGYIQDFDVALDFAYRGLKMRPTSPVLLNGVAFAAGSLDRLDEAEAALRKLKLDDADRTQRLIAAANRGLIAFRRGNEKAGRLHYIEAIEGFRRDGANEMAARAKIYLAREALLAREPDWRTLLKDAQDSMSKFKESDATPSLKLVEAQAAEFAVTDVTEASGKFTAHAALGEYGTNTHVNVSVQFDLERRVT